MHSDRPDGVLSLTRVKLGIRDPQVHGLRQSGCATAIPDLSGHPYGGSAHLSLQPVISVPVFKFLGPGNPRKL